MEICAGGELVLPAQPARTKDSTHGATNERNRRMDTLTRGWGSFWTYSEAPRGTGRRFTYYDIMTWRPEKRMYPALPASYCMSRQFGPAFASTASGTSNL